MEWPSAISSLFMQADDPEAPVPCGSSQGTGTLRGRPGLTITCCKQPFRVLSPEGTDPRGITGMRFLLLPKIEEACKVKSRKEGGRGVYLTQLELLRRTFGHSSDCKHLILACPTPEGGGLLTLSLHPQGPPASF